MASVIENPKGAAPFALAADDQLMTPVQLAAELGVAVATLADWRVQGGDATPPYVKVGKFVRYPRSGVHPWLAQRIRASTSSPGTVKHAD